MLGYGFIAIGLNIANAYSHRTCYCKVNIVITSCSNRNELELRISGDVFGCNCYFIADNDFCACNASRSFIGKDVGIFN